jgi:hypothetical protein
MARQALCAQALLYEFLDNTQTHTTVGRTPLDEGSARCRDLYPITQTLTRDKTSMPPAGFEPAIPASGRRQTHTLDCAATGIGNLYGYTWKYYIVNGLHGMRITLYFLPIRYFDFPPLFIWNLRLSP